MSAYTGKLKHEGHYILEEDGGAIGVFGGTDPANAIRLVACWNALTQVPTEWLEQYNRDPNVDSVVDSIITENDKLRIERDELVALLYDLLSVADTDPELSLYPAAKATRELLAEKYPEAS